MATQGKTKKVVKKTKKVTKKPKSDYAKLGIGQFTGRPPLFKTVQELEKIIGVYFQYCIDNFERPTIAGLAYHTGFHRDAIYSYEKKDRFADTIKRARDFILYRWEEHALSTTNAAGVIFVMKNYGYSDNSKLDVTSKGDKVKSIDVTIRKPNHADS